MNLKRDLAKLRDANGGQDLFIPDAPGSWHVVDARNKTFTDRVASQVLVVSAGRSGSSFLGDIINSFPGRNERN